MAKMRESNTVRPAHLAASSRAARQVNQEIAGQQRSTAVAHGKASVPVKKMVHPGPGRGDSVNREGVVTAVQADEVRPPNRKRAKSIRQGVKRKGY